jgi:hypothetical protein
MEGGGQRSEVRGQRAEDRDQMKEETIKAPKSLQQEVTGRSLARQGMAERGDGARQGLRTLRLEGNVSSGNH